jgi:serine protease inhibitor
MAGAAMPQNSLTIDRPFIFLIRDIPTGAILFVGRVLNPAS